jgi:hypothetical protein
MTQEQTLPLTERLWQALEERQIGIMAYAAKIDAFLEDEHPAMLQRLQQLYGEGSVAEAAGEDAIVEYMAKGASDATCIYWETILGLHRMMSQAGAQMPVSTVITVVRAAVAHGYYQAVQDLLNEEIAL